MRNEEDLSNGTRHARRRQLVWIPSRVNPSIEIFFGLFPAFGGFWA